MRTDSHTDELIKETAFFSYGFVFYFQCIFSLGDFSATLVFSIIYFFFKTTLLLLSMLAVTNFHHFHFQCSSFQHLSTACSFCSLANPSKAMPDFCWTYCITFKYALCFFFFVCFLVLPLETSFNIRLPSSSLDPLDSSSTTKHNSTLIFAASRITPVEKVTERLWN